MKGINATSKIDPSGEATASKRRISKPLGPENDFQIMMQISKYNYILYRQMGTPICYCLNSQMTKSLSYKRIGRIAYNEEKLWVVLVGNFQQELKLFRNLKGHRTQCKVESTEVTIKLLKNYFAIHTNLKGIRFFTVHGMFFLLVIRGSLMCRDL